MFDVVDDVDRAARRTHEILRQSVRATAYFVDKTAAYGTGIIKFYVSIHASLDKTVARKWPSSLFMLVTHVVYTSTFNY